MMCDWKRAVRFWWRSGSRCGSRDFLREFLGWFFSISHPSPPFPFAASGSGERWSSPTDLDKILHTPIAERIKLVGRLRPRSGQTKTTKFFVILVTYPKSYIETTNRLDFGGKPSEWMWERVLLSWQIPELCSVGGARSKNSIFSRFRVPFDYPAHSLQEIVLPQTNGTDGKPRLESLWSGISEI